MTTAVYPGSFDPTTNGHIDIIRRAAKIVDTLIVAVLDNHAKNSMFSVAERVSHLKEITKDIENVKIDSFSGLLVDFAKINNVKMIVRGLRALTDFEFEFQMALTNRELSGEIETLFIPTSKEYLFLSSSVVKEIARFSGDYSGMVPEIIKRELERKFNI
ncbi:MAG: pantetheine-phosphate adenylyltransferase [Defluviitaleaceae bacterium]|nr:pantetheine-phosphate adenylyltransferase [Defluviitaleaceae bacterium]